MVHDKVLTIIQSQSTLRLVNALAAPHAYVTDDDILRFRGNNASAINCDTLTRSRLPRDGDVAGDGDALARDIDDTTHVKHHKAVRLTDRISQRPCTCSIQVRHMHHLLTTSPRCIGTITLSTRKRQLLCLHRASAQPRE